MARKKTQKKTAKKSLAFLKALLWSLCFLALLLTLDQLALRLQPTTPVLQELQSSYREFRSRLLGRKPQPPLTIEAVIDRDVTAPVARPIPTPAKKPATKPARTVKPQPGVKQAAAQPAAQQYLYVDTDGDLQFADRLEDIPPALRDNAQPLKD